MRFVKDGLIVCATKSTASRINQHLLEMTLGTLLWLPTWDGKEIIRVGFKLGCQVRVTWNHCIEDGLVNGATGVLLESNANGLTLHMEADIFGLHKRFVWCETIGGKRYLASGYDIVFGIRSDSPQG